MKHPLIHLPDAYLRKTTSRIFRWFLLLGAIVPMLRCANPMSPTGGPKDTTPPKVVLAKPENNSLHFTSKEIELTFDEFISLKDARNQVNIAPPQLPNTDLRLHGKTLHISIDDSLKPNTTYSISLGQAIADITESNIFRDYSYVFSTGDFIDSLSFAGRIVDAFTLAPQKDVMACLYVNNNDTLPFDSLPIKVKPWYLVKTNENGEFVIRNVMDKPLMATGLKDMNGNIFYDLPNEKIAFCDTLVHAVWVAPPPPDTSKPTKKIAKDSVPPLPVRPMITLRLFELTDSVQRIVRSELPLENKAVLVFRYPNKSVTLEPLNITADNWCIREDNPTKDTLVLYLRTTRQDTLSFRVLNEKGTVDTVRLDLSLLHKKRSTKRGTEAAAAERVSIGSNLFEGKLNYFKGTLQLVFNYPLESSRLNRIRLIEGKDTTTPVMVFADSIHRKILVKNKWKEDKAYQVFIPDSVFFTFNRLTNDTSRLAFNTRAAKEFGSFLVNVTFPAPGENYILQLLTDKDDIRDQRILHGPGKVLFDYLFPGKYKLRIIHDRNRNGHWDTGDYRIKLQPEEVFLFPKITEIRSNWDVEETWDRAD
jgi:hypothetical protein